MSIRGDGYGSGANGSIRSSNNLRYRAVGNNNSTRNSIQSQNYEPDESEVWRAYIAQKHLRNRGHWWTTGKKQALNQWLLTLIIGVVQGIVAFLCNILSKKLSDVKFEHVYGLLESSGNEENGNEQNTNDDLYNLYSKQDGDENVVNENPSLISLLNHSPFLVFLMYNLFYASIAAFFVYLEPLAAGSGIPEVKCFLNGIALPGVVEMKTLVCKVIGVAFAVSASFPLGKEGPMIHAGAIVAAVVSQGGWHGGEQRFQKFSGFRNDHEKRDFVACGAAAGISAAFGTPIGGVLFSLEEGASYWSTNLTWRAFFCCMITLTTLFGVKFLDINWGQTEIEKLFSLGEFNSIEEASNFSIWELWLFILIGSLGGLIGAVFNEVNEVLTKWRMRYINISKFRRVLEVLAVSIFVSIVTFSMPLLWSHCTDLPSDMQDWTNQEKNLVESLIPFRCDPDKEYNEVASLMLTDADTAIKQLFHFRESGQNYSHTFSSAALFLFFILYIGMAVITYGIAVPSGLFVPSLLSGAAFGRLCGHLFHKLDHTSGTFADSGTYALMGAAALLAGMSRMTISITVLLLEATGDMQYVLPLMLTVMTARFTGNVFNEGLYDIHIKLKKIPFLEADVPSIAEKHEMVAGQIMSSDVKCLRPVERAGVVYDLLNSCSHYVFPIVDTSSGGTLYGTASRSMLCTLLKSRAFGPPDILRLQDDNTEGIGPRRLSPLVQWDVIEGAYPNYPTIHDVILVDSDRKCWLDLRPYANTAPYTINETASVQRTYRLFRTLGLRHLCVVNHFNQVVGIITRKDLMPDSLSNCFLSGRSAHNSTTFTNEFV